MIDFIIKMMNFVIQMMNCLMEMMNFVCVFQTASDGWGNDYFDDIYQVNGVPKRFKGYCTDVLLILTLLHISYIILCYYPVLFYIILYYPMLSRHLH